MMISLKTIVETMTPTPVEVKLPLWSMAGLKKASYYRTLNGAREAANNNQLSFNTPYESKAVLAMHKAALQPLQAVLLELAL